MVGMPSFHSNIPSSIFYPTVMSEVLRIARASSSVTGFNEKCNVLINRMENQGGNRRKLIKQILRAYQNHPLVFRKYNISDKDILKTFC